MAQVPAALVKQLRDQTNAGMMDCKKALAESDNDLEAAVDWLRKKGLAAAAKKAGRVAAEGLVGVAAEGPVGAVVEVNSETDFVSRNETFQGFVATVAQHALAGGGDLEALKATDYPGTGRTVADELTHLIATIGENMTLRRVARLAVDQGAVASYVHNAAAPGVGKIGVLVALESAADSAALQALGRQLAMHVAAASPQSVSREDLDPAAIERERSVLIAQAEGSGKPKEIIEKMVEGRLRKFYEEVCLLDQVYVIDTEKKVGQAIEAQAKALGQPIRVAGFVKLVLGEGVEKEEQDFAAEVAATLKG